MSYPISFKQQAGNGYPGDQIMLVQSGTTASITPGTPVVKTLSSPYVVLGADGIPVVGTDYMAGIAMSTSTETASADGKVAVYPLLPGTIYLMAPKSPSTYFGAAYATIPSQSTYDAKVGDRVVFDLTASVWTIDSVDSANNGLVVEPIDVNLYFGLVAFSIRAGASYLA